MLRRHLIGLAARIPLLLPGIEERVPRHRLVAARGLRHAKISGRSVVWKGPEPVGHDAFDRAGGAGDREDALWSGRTGSGRGAASQLLSAITAARACGATGRSWPRRFGNKAVIGAAVTAGIEFSLVMTRSPWITRAIESIDGSDWMPVRYPGAVTDPDAGELISDAEVAETPYTAFSGPPPGHRPTDRAPGQDANHLDGLFPMWRTPVLHQIKSEVPTVDADVTYRNCAIVGGIR